MNKWSELVLGLILVIAPIVVAISYPSVVWNATLQTLIGGVVLVIILIGLLFLMLGISDMKG